MNEYLIDKYQFPAKLQIERRINIFDELIEIMQPLLDLHQINLKYQRKGCVRNGAAVLKINSETKEKEYTIFLDRNSKELAMCNIFIHELMHILLDHLVKKKDNKFYLPRKACEFVVDYIAETVIYCLTNQLACNYFTENSDSYRKLWLQNAKINLKQKNLIEFQIDYGIELLTEYIEEQK